MDSTLFGIKNLDQMLVLGVLVTFSLLEAAAGYLSSSKRKPCDWIQEAGSFFVLSLLIKPGIVLAVMFIGQKWFGEYSLSLSSWSLWLMLPFFLFIDDVLQYWYHRSSHEYQWLWKLHRPHHQAEEMGFFVSYRNAALFYIMMPNIWWIGLVVFLGGAKAVSIGLILKQCVIIGSHSRITWDAPLYRYRIFHPLMSVVERIIVTPAFHHAHHGKSIQDGISHPNGNFGNMFSLWDQLFGSAVYTRRFPTEYGLVNNSNDHWAASWFYPAVASSDPASEIARGFEKESTKTCEPVMLELEPVAYVWCRCGLSKNQPFCDGSHHGTRIHPCRFELDRERKVKLCNCKATDKAPWCDNSHQGLPDNS